MGFASNAVPTVRYPNTERLGIHKHFTLNQISDSLLLYKDQVGIRVSTQEDAFKMFKLELLKLSDQLKNNVQKDQIVQILKAASDWQDQQKKAFEFLTETSKSLYVMVEQIAEKEIQKDPIEFIKRETFQVGNEDNYSSDEGEQQPVVVKEEQFPPAKRLGGGGLRDSDFVLADELRTQNEYHKEEKGVGNRMNMYKHHIGGITECNQGENVNFSVVSRQSPQIFKRLNYIEENFNLAKKEQFTNNNNQGSSNTSPLEEAKERERLENMESKRFVV